MKIATFNVNSIRQRLPIVLGWLERHQPDVFCLQETKVQDQDFPVEAVEKAGYQASFRGMKGYNGVATLTRVAPEEVLYGLHESADNEDFRILRVKVNGIHVVNTYVPQGNTVGSEKYLYKLEWFLRLRKYFQTHLDPAQPAIWLGDLNVAPEPIDVYHPEKRTMDVDFHIDARNAYQQTKSWGFVDVYRKLHPDTVQYTYWDYFRNAFARNFGWRIDHILATEVLAERCVAAGVDMEARGLPSASDHTVMWADFDLGS